MNLRSLIILLVLAMFLPGCFADDCNPCFTPPEPFIFAIVDKTSGENLFTNGSYTPAQINIIDTADSSKVAFTFIDENNLDLIQIASIGWQTEAVTINISIANNSIFNLFVDAERISDECCSFTNYNEIRIDNTAYEFDTVSGIYTILVE